MNNIVGVDEVGRGCLAGPVVAAAVLFRPGEYLWMQEIKDSKKLSAKKREYLSELIKEHSLWGIREESAHTIDDGNILKSTLRAMYRAVCVIHLQERQIDMVLVDGNQRIPDLKIPQTTITSGDNLFPQIAAASIIAKVYRDDMMSALHLSHPEYGWERNKGYGTVEHREAIMIHGITPLHRVTFKGVTEYA